MKNILLSGHSDISQHCTVVEKCHLLPKITVIFIPLTSSKGRAKKNESLLSPMSNYNLLRLPVSTWYIGFFL